MKTLVRWAALLAFGTGASFLCFPAWAPRRWWRHLLGHRRTSKRSVRGTSDQVRKLLVVLLLSCSAWASVSFTNLTHSQVAGPVNNIVSNSITPDPQSGHARRETIARSPAKDQTGKSTKALRSRRGRAERSRGGQVSERTPMIPLYCIVDRKQIPEERVRRGAKTCDKECQKVFRRAFILDRKERYRRAAGLPPSTKSTSGQRNSVPGAVYAEADRVTEVTAHPTL
jgi:hypothetical protein